MQKLKKAIKDIKAKLKIQLKKGNPNAAFLLKRLGKIK
jgi:hypothetical protein